MSDWYDREGNKITTADYDTEPDLWMEQMGEVEKKLSDRSYKVLKQENTPEGKYWISTVWLGLDHSFSGSKPLIFETMVFDRHNGEVDYASNEMKRYSTEAAALKGHVRMVKKWTKTEGREA